MELHDRISTEATASYDVMVVWSACSAAGLCDFTLQSGDACVQGSGLAPIDCALAATPPAGSMP
jgi:hypothetical protein